MQQFNQFRTYAEGENMPITEDGISGVMARNSGVSMKGGGALSAAARKVQSAGFGEDKILVHINPSEYAELIRKHGPVTYNDETGLPQLGFFKSLGKILKTVAPLAVSFIPGIGPLAGAALGAGIGAATSGGKLSGILSGAAMGSLGAGISGAGGWGSVFKGGIGSGLSNLGTLATQTSLFGDPTASGLGGLMAKAVSPAGLGLLGLSATKQNKSNTGANTTPFPTLPNQVSPGNYANAPNITAPTLQQMAAVQQPAQQSQNVQLPDGRIVPASYLQNGILNFTGQQNDYTQSSNPVFARTGGLAQVKRYDAGGTVTPAPFVPTRRVLTAPELQAQGMDFEHYGEKPRPVGMQSFYTPYTTAPVAPTPLPPVAPVVTPTTPVVDQTNYGDGDGTTDGTYGGRVPVGPTTTDQYGTTRDSQGTVFSANVDTSKYWDPTTGKYLGNWPGVDQYLREQEAARNPTVKPSNSEPGYFDPNYFDNAVGVKKGGALSQVSRYVSGDGDGQADKIPAMLSDGEYVMDAESVSALGNGSSKAGAKRLDEFRMNLRKHKRSAPVGKIPPKTKKLNKYMSGGSR